MATVSRRFSSRGATVIAALLAGLTASAGQAAGTLYLERCAGTCVYHGGPNNSCNNVSSIVSGIRTITAFEHGDDAWQQVTACVQATLAPFDITVTDVDPGCAAPFWEIVVAGTPNEIGQPPGTAGVAPFSCGVIPNAPAFAFAGVHTDMLALCWTVTHEFTHLLGADHQLHAGDPMTYLPGCLPKRFAAAAADCGEGSPRSCCTGAATQVSSEIVRAAISDRSGGPLFGDPFEVWNEVAQSVEGSTCHWDSGEGVEPLEVELMAGAPQLACGTKTDSR